MKRLSLCFYLCVVNLCYGQVQPIGHGHAHNDYMHKRPLFEALKNGFTSIEVDVFLHNNDLVVSHEPTGLNKKPDIESLYLKPILDRIKQNGGVVYKGYSTPVILMVELKTSAAEGYAKLKEILLKYRDILAVYRGDSIIVPGPIHILITGHQPYESVMKEDSCFVTIDGDVEVLEHQVNEKIKVVTRFSAPWSSRFTWDGTGNMPGDERAKLNSLVAEAHRFGKDIRFYAIPDKAEVWKVLLDAKVDWVNTDKLAGYSAFYRQY